MKKVTIGLLLLSQFSLFTQNFKFGKVSKEELSEKFYPLDSTADAAYLYKYRNTYYKYKQGIGYMIITEVHETGKGAKLNKTVPDQHPEVVRPLQT